MVIRSGKKDVFIAGADITEIEALESQGDAANFSQQGQEALAAFERLPFATLAMIDRACLGGGLEPVLACTRRVATENPKTVLGFPEVNLGLIPG